MEAESEAAVGEVHRNSGIEAVRLLLGFSYMLRERSLGQRNGHMGIFSIAGQLLYWNSVFLNAEIRNTEF